MTMNTLQSIFRGVSRGAKIAQTQQPTTRSILAPLTASQLQTQAWNNVGKAIRQAMDTHPAEYTDYSED